MLSNVVFFIFVCCCITQFHTISGQNGNLQFRDNFTSLSEALQDAEKFILKFNQTYNFPSLSFGLSVKGKSVWQKSWGFADLENYVPAKVTTKYRIASISKTFTAVLIGSLVDRGLLHFDDLLSQYVNESTFPSKQWKGKSVNITIRQLMSHMAGTHLTDVSKDFAHVELAPNVTQMIHLFKDEPLLFEPGTNFAYSNYGFQLLGAIVESVTRKPFQQVMSEFMRLHGLESSYVGNLSTILHDSARHYMAAGKDAMKENVPSVLEELFFLGGYWPAGGVVTNVPDLLHYGQLLIDSYKGRRHNGTAIVAQQTLKQLWSAQARNIPGLPFYVQFDYGLGWFVANGNNTKLKHQHMVGHQGGLPGVTSMLLIYPEEEIVSVALTNKGGVLELDQMIVYTVENVYGLVK